MKIACALEMSQMHLPNIKILSHFYVDGHNFNFWANRVHCEKVNFKSEAFDSLIWSMAGTWKVDGSSTAVATVRSAQLLGP